MGFNFWCPLSVEFISETIKDTTKSSWSKQIKEKNASKLDEKSTYLANMQNFGIQTPLRPLFEINCTTFLWSIQKFKIIILPKKCIKIGWKIESPKLKEIGEISFHAFQICKILEFGPLLHPFWNKYQHF